MSKKKHHAHAMRFLNTRVLWIEQAAHFPKFLQETRELLDECSGFRLTPEEIGNEALVILGFLLLETDSFEGRTDKERKRELHALIEVYVRIRDEDGDQGMERRNIISMVRESGALLRGRVRPKLEPELQ